ncbi:MAG: nucleolar DEAD-box protein required for synthesis of 60S ribosomal subunit [Phylliscum demangeonii]|nr:MAG: nucleolar DEAD-box protein required for synthesis of 60S ribosomal subunit [Phylliscum demangeonii]
MSAFQDDEFILTLTDDEQNDEQSIEESDQISVVPSDGAPPLSGRKRKRKANADHPPALSGKDKKKQRRADTSGATVKGLAGSDPATSSPDATRQAAESSSAELEEDEGMRSDFEFFSGDATTGILEDFDGWEREDGKEITQASGTRTAVGLEEIIARRLDERALKDGHGGKSGNEQTSELHETGQDDAISEGDVFEGADDLDDELIADDGFGMGADPEMEQEVEPSESVDHDGHDNRGIDSDEEEDAASDRDSIASPLPHPYDAANASDDQEEAENSAEAARRKAFFAPEDSAPETKSTSLNVHRPTAFQNMSLSRPVLRGLAAVGFTEPTPIQAKTIPVALLGKDVVGGAVTGSGKTAAFLVPILERLLFRPKRVPTSRVAILMPTRELAVQCHNVARKLAAYTDITFCRLIGGYSLREQENELKKRPDVIIATPGRFIDHMRNSASFTLETLEILVLDEADRMLEDGFADELNEILKSIPKSRQTMLFSATMTDSVDKLIRVGLTRPVRLMLAAKQQTVSTLVQEFLRLRPGRESKRLGYLMVLCQSVHMNRAIVFFRQKVDAHRVRIVFGLFGLKAAELHGSMSQEQRIQSVEAFRDGKVSFLLATDLASRGLDIRGVETVINYEAPQSYDIYLHRVGRTARAGRTGRACTFAAEADRKVVRAAVSAAKAQGAKVISRTIDAAEADACAQKIHDMDDEIEAILREEKEQKLLAQAEMQITRGENLIMHKDAIMARPRRTWFETEAQKRAAKKLGHVELNGAGIGMNRDPVREMDAEKEKEKRKRKLSGKDKKKMEDGEQRRGGKIWKKGKEMAKMGKAKARPAKAGKAKGKKVLARPATRGPKSNGRR